MGTLIRHGEIDILSLDEAGIAWPDELPASHPEVLAEGETGHLHAVKGVDIYGDLKTDDLVFFEVIEGTVVAHQDKAGQWTQEHLDIQLPPARYVAWKQRQHAPGEIQKVFD